MKNLCWVLATLFFLVPCVHLSAQQKTLQAAQGEFARVDRTLNEVYQAAKSDLPTWRFEKIREEQRSWLEFRDERALSAARFDGGAEEGQEKENAEYWNALAYLTETRIEILRAWMRVGDYPKPWEGVWIDGYGGLLSVEETDAGKLRFALQVVRGPTHHSGAISGEARFKGITARFSTLADGDEEDTWLTFLQEDGQLRIIGENTGYFHGARAYFDGRYIRIRELTEKDREDIRSPDF